MTETTPNGLNKLDPVFEESTSLAAALAKFLGLPETEQGRAVRVRSAVALFCRLTGLAPEAVSADRMYIMRQWERVKKRPADVGPKTIANAKAELRYLLDQTVPQAGRSEFRPLNEAWKALDDQLGQKKRQLIWALTRFFQYCSSRGIAPGQVSEAVFADYQAWLELMADTSKPREMTRAAIRNWNKAVDLVPKWPQRKIVIEKKGPPRKWLTKDQLPPAFTADMNGWLDRLGRKRQLGEPGPKRPSRPITLKHRESQIRRAVTALHLSGIPLEAIQNLACLVEPKNYIRLLEYLLEENGGNKTESIHHLAGGLINIARHHIGVDEASLQILNDVRRDLVPDESRAGKRATERVERLQDPNVKRQFVGLPEKLIKIAESARTPKRHRPVLAQVAICLEIALFTSFRRKNLVNLRLEDLQTIYVDGEERFRIIQNADEVKNDQTLDRELPNASIKLIRRGLALYQQKNGWLFPGRNGKSKQIDFISKQIKAVIEKNLAITFNIHLVRSFIAVEVIAATGSVEAAALAIGDKNIEMVRKAYGGHADKILLRQAQDRILQIRSGHPTSAWKQGR